MIWFIVLMISPFIQEGFSSDIIYVKKEPGQFAVFICKANVVSQNARCLWHHSTEAVNSTTVRYTYNDAPDNSNECTMIIMMLNPLNDSGLWQCDMHDQNQSFYQKRWNLTFDVNEAIITNVQFHPNTSTNTVEGQSLELMCLVNPPENVSIVWSKFKEKMDFTGNSLKFSNITRNDTGEYECAVSNVAGLNKVVTKEIIVMYGPEIESIILSHRNVAWLKQSVHIQCNVHGYPLPNITWFKRNPHELKYENITAQRGERNVLPYLSQNVFYITEIDYLSQGYYLCNASSSFNGLTKYVASKEVFIDVVGRPVIFPKKSSNTTIRTTYGGFAVFLVYFCSDPIPAYCYWTLSNGRVVEPNTTVSRFTARNIRMDPTHPDCFSSALYLSTARRRDSGEIVFTVSNTNGTDKYHAKLYVSGVETDVLVGIGIVSVSLLALISAVYMYKAYKKKSYQQQSTAARLWNEKTPVDDVSLRSSIDDMPYTFE